MIRLAECARRFRDEEDGSMAIELVLVTPIIVWVVLSTYVYFDIFRVESNANRASLVVAEMLSREETPITKTYMDSALEVLEVLTYEEVAPDLRVTVYEYSSDDTSYRVVWSDVRPVDGLDELKNTDLLKIKDRLPKMNTIDHAILVETFVDYNAPFSVGLGPMPGTNLDSIKFDTFTVIRPRIGRLCFDPNTNVDSDELCGSSGNLLN
ncbi:hypothetical protein MWU60_18880 [Yoonia sp. F2084L]|uniref:TadE/TadG family type IV pilus assembly protein n=1 Tax=Yoonia sp. F2084L TaxID=2926419 RepID=UPI001FF47DE8|nr:hypothetical protein [Yoonia sp. F2084L]MCK0097645.1 hypothetical protein [Yoonia sp. F2084L]